MLPVKLKLKVMLLSEQSVYSKHYFTRQYDRLIFFFLLLSFQLFCIRFWLHLDYACTKLNA